MLRKPLSLIGPSGYSFTIPFWLLMHFFCFCYDLLPPLAHAVAPLDLPAAASKQEAEEAVSLSAPLVAAGERTLASGNRRSLLRRQPLPQQDADAQGK